MTARINLGSALMQRGDLAAAVTVLRDVTRLQPANAEARYNLGLALKQQDDFAGAETELRRATELDANLPEAFYTLGVVLWQTGRGEEAAGAFRVGHRAPPRLCRCAFHARHRSQAKRRDE